MSFIPLCKKLLFSVIALAFAGLAQAQSELALEVYNADARSFHVNSVLIYGKKDAILFDTGFSRADALRIAGMVLDSQKTLKLIYISQPDPDYYFGIDILKSYFPQVNVVATASTVNEIKNTLRKKLEFWPPRMGSNAPGKVPLPAVLKENVLDIEGQSLEIRGTDGMLGGRSYVWIPSMKTVLAGNNIFSGLHAWTANTPSPKERMAWVKKLDEIAALKPARVIAGHSAAGQPQDSSQILFTSNWLERFEMEVTQSKDSADLINRMKAAYPNAGLQIGLEIGAKVAKGEMTWP